MSHLSRGWFSLKHPFFTMMFWLYEFYQILFELSKQREREKPGNGPGVADSFTG